MWMNWIYMFKTILLQYKIVIKILPNNKNKYESLIWTNVCIFSKVKIQGGRKLRQKYSFRSHHRHHQHSIKGMQRRYSRKFNQSTRIKFKYKTASNDINTVGGNHFPSDFTFQSQNVTSDYEKNNIDKNNVNTKDVKRRKRSISSPRHVEALIVADATMVAFHSKLETYLLTIMNMVSALYKDPSIGNSIEIVVVKIILFEDHEAHPDLNLTQNAQKNLDKFCRWVKGKRLFEPHIYQYKIINAVIFMYLQFLLNCNCCLPTKYFWFKLEVSSPGGFLKEPKWM